jgi:excisionase family DNA binding protein
MEEKILTPEQVAQILQVHQFTVLKFIKQGKLHASKLGRVYRIRSSDVERFLDQTSGRPVKPPSTESIELNYVKKSKNKNKTTSQNTSVSLPQSENTATSETTDQTPITVEEVQVSQVESPSSKSKQGGEDHYYIIK